jgi:Polyketide cyclase / dehydrase and lipid transport
MAKVMLFVVLALLVVGVVLALVAPKKISITSTQFIAAPKQKVFDQIRLMKNFPNWSPFKVQDPEQKFSISGNDGEIGATFHWEGVKEKSKGSQTVSAISGNDQVTIRCNITEPFQANPVFDYTLVEKNGGVEVTQQFDTDMPIPANIFGLLMGLKAEIAATNKQGLELLKKVSE